MVLLLPSRFSNVFPEPYSLSPNRLVSSNSNPFPANISLDMPPQNTPQDKSNGLPLPALAASHRPSSSKRTVAIALAGVWILALWGIFYLWHTGSVGLVDETEPLFVEAARQMTVTGDWITPYFNGETRFDKPPLIYWAIAIFNRIIGANEWSARLPSALSALALMVGGFWTIWKFVPAADVQLGGESWTAKLRDKLQRLGLDGRWWTAALGAAIIGMTPETIVWGRAGVSDMLLSACIGVSLFAFFWGYATPERSPKMRWYWLSYLAIALGILTKGPIGFVLPALIIFCFGLYLGELRTLWREIKPWRGLALILAVSLPWYIAVITIHGQTYIDSFFGYHNFSRFTRVVNQHAAPWYFYFVVIAVGFLPWSVFLPWAIARLNLLNRSRWISRPRRDRLRLFAGFWLIAIFGFFSIAVTKLPSYVLPAMPAAGILVTFLVRDIWTGNWDSSAQPSRPGTSIPLRSTKTWGFRTSHWTLVATFAILTVGFIASPLWLPTIRDPDMPNIAIALSQSGLLPRAALTFGAATLLSAWAILSDRDRHLALITGTILVIFFTSTAMPVIFLLDSQRQQPLREISVAAVETRQPNEPLVMAGFNKPSMAFYTQQPMHFFKRLTDAQRAMAQPTWPEPGKTPAGDRAQPSETVLLVVGDDKYNDANLAAIATGDRITRVGEYHLLRIPRTDLANHIPPPN
ncbi:MAG: glycosyltransferase family 39 protein [Cyanobacteria bacterium P01_D01_bin.73]